MGVVIMEFKEMFHVEHDGRSYMWDSQINQWYVLDNDGNWIKEIVSSKIKKLKNYYEKWCDDGKNL
jgi:hypothetical protein